jgi:hypothetical protein
MYSLLRSLMEEQATHNPLVAGSSPACPTFLPALTSAFQQDSA